MRDATRLRTGGRRAKRKTQAGFAKCAGGGEPPGKLVVEAKVAVKIGATVGDEQTGRGVVKQEVAVRAAAPDEDEEEAATVGKTIVAAAGCCGET